MKKISFVKKFILSAAAIAALLGINVASAFDWPQNETSSDSFFSYFGQLRGGTIEPSIVFSENSEVKAAEKGNVAIILTEHDKDYGWFESTLGNTVIIAHADQMDTIYANLDEDDFAAKDFTKTEVRQGEYLGTSGNSGWQMGENCLEFQVIDTKTSSAVNPRGLMPRIGNELPLVMGRIYLEDEAGVLHNLLNEHVLAPGMYKVYHTRQEVAVPKRTSVALNGVTIETIYYDTLKEVDGHLCAIGNKNYTVEQLYPDPSRQLLGCVQLTTGKAALKLALVDILETAQTITYNLEIK